MGKIALIGEAYGADEEEASKKAGKPCPFVGNAGKMLDTLLRSAGISREDCYITNVFNLRPKDNDILTLFAKKSEGDTAYPPLRNGKYVLPVYSPEITRLRNELEEYKPDVIVPLGSTPLWALTGYANISARRGAWHAAERVLPTFHPAYVLRVYTHFPLAVSDLWKAKGLADGTIKPANFDLIPRPSYAQVLEFCNQPLDGSKSVIFDIETSPKYRTITAVGVGIGGQFMCIPFADERSRGFSYWGTGGEELAVWGAIRRCLETPDVPKIAHHSTYDLTWLYQVMGIRVAGPVFDTRIIHHALLPELPHRLGSIGHTYFVLPPWKALRKAAKEEQE